MGMAFKCLLFTGLVITLIGQSKQAVYSHSQAVQILSSAGIPVTSTGQCTNRRNSQCTSLDGIHSEAIEGVITLKRASGCPIIVTGGTETGHGSSRSPNARTHGNGWKLDIRKRGEDCITKYIKANFPKYSANRWRAPSGNIYYDERNHWDIQYGNNNRGKRELDTFADSLLSYHENITFFEPNGEIITDKIEFETMQKSNISARNKRNTDECLRCICNVESGCRPLACKWDVNSLSCGYFQIKREYYVDCYTPERRSGESIDLAWKRCAASYSCSAQCIKNYVARFGFKCAGVGNCQKISRLHNGGPNGCKKSATNRYWNKVYSCLP